MEKNKITVGDTVNAMVTSILVKHNVTLVAFRRGPITPQIKKAAREMSEGSVLLDRSFLHQYVGIPHDRIHNILRHANR